MSISRKARFIGVNRLGTMRLGTVPKADTLEVDPVLFFDKSSVESSSIAELLTITEVAKILKISVSGVRRLQQARQLPFVKIGGSVRFAKQDLLSYLSAHRVEAIG